LAPGFKFRHPQKSWVHRGLSPGVVLVLSIVLGFDFLLANIIWLLSGCAATSFVSNKTAVNDIVNANVTISKLLYLNIKTFPYNGIKLAQSQMFPSLQEFI
jgi:hypothetical protein